MLIFNIYRLCMMDNSMTSAPRNVRIDGHADLASIRHPWLWGFLAFVFYYIVFQAFYNKIATGTFYPYTELWQLPAHMALNFIPISLIYITDCMIIFKLNHINDIRCKMLLDFVFANIGVVIIDFLFIAALFGSEYDTVNWAGTFFSNFILFFAIEAVYYMVNFQRKVQEAELQKQTALRYRYTALKTQMTPHFLFNSLNMLSALVNFDGSKAKEFIRWLSQVYHYTLAKQDAELATLEEELDFMHSYVNILTLRYKGKFSVDVSGTEYVSNQLLPPYTLQLLIENITKHNTISARHPMHVNVKISREEMRVSNPINYRRSKSPSHLGLRYLTELYSSYDKDFRIENNGETFTAFIPYITRKSDKAAQPPRVTETVETL